MAMVKGDLVKPNDIIEAIKTRIQTYLSGFKDKAVSGASFGGSETATMNDVNNEITAQFTGNSVEHQGKRGKTIFIDSVLNCIFRAMWQACRCGTIKYKVYKYKYSTSTWEWPPLVEHTIKGIFSTINSPYTNNPEQYRSEAIALIGGSSSLPGPRDIIQAAPLANIMDKCIQFNNTHERIKDNGNIDTCYSSCHSNCHGSSRSRR